MTTSDSMRKKGMRKKMLCAAAVSLLVTLSLVSIFLHDNDEGTFDEDMGLGGLNDSSYFESLGGYIEIATEDDFTKIGVDPAFPANGKYYLSDNIVFVTKKSSFSGIGTLLNPFTGIFDGNGFSISGIDVTFFSGAGELSSTSLFAYVGGEAEILNLGSVNNHFWSFKGATVEITAGIVGYVAAGADIKIINCYRLNGSLFTASGMQAYTGGIVGLALGKVTMSGCYNSLGMDTRGANGYSGGLIGYSAVGAEITNSYSRGTQHATSTFGSSIGGLVGCLELGTLTIKNSYNTGTINSIPDDKNRIPISHLGGIVGNVAGGSVIIEQCYNTGRTYSESSNSRAVSGGIIGSAAYGSEISITDCYNTGNMSAVSDSSAAYAGGIIGHSSTPVTVTNCYSTGLLKATGPEAYARGIIAFGTEATVYNCYFLEGTLIENDSVASDRLVNCTDLSLDGNSDGTPRDGPKGSGVKTSAELAYSLHEIRLGNSVYEIGPTGPVLGWDFDHIWTITEGVNNGYPIFGKSPPMANVTFYDPSDAEVGKILIYADTPIPKGKIPLVMNIPGFEYRWYTEIERINVYDFSANVPEGDLDLYLKYTKIDDEWADVIFHDTDDGVIKTASVLIGTPIRGSTVPMTVLTEGYKAVWYTESERLNVYDFGSDVIGTLHLYLKFTEIPVIWADVIFHDTDNSVISTVSVLIGTPVRGATIPAVITPEGYKAVWYTESERYNVYDFGADVIGTLHLYLTFADVASLWADVSFYDHENNLISKVSVLIGTPIRGATIPMVISLDGFKAAWHTEIDRLNVYDFGSDVTGPLSLYLKFSEIDDVSGGGSVLFITEGKCSFLWLIPLAVGALLALIAFGLILWRKRGLEIGVISDVKNNGSQITPVPWVKFNGKLLTAGEDFEYSYGENTHAGEGSVTITFGRSGSSVTVYFRIV